MLDHSEKSNWGAAAPAEGVALGVSRSGGRFNPSRFGVLEAWRPDVAGARADQPSARVLLLGMREPADGSAERKKPERGARLESEVARQHPQRPIDVRQPPRRGRQRRGNGSRRRRGGAPGLIQQIQEQAGPRIAVGIERMAEARRDLAAPQALRDLAV